MFFEEAILKRKVRNDVYAYKYQNGVIEIDGTKYQCYSMTDAIKKWRSDNPIKQKQEQEIFINDIHLAHLPLLINGRPDTGKLYYGKSIALNLFKDDVTLITVESPKQLAQELNNLVTNCVVIDVNGFEKNDIVINILNVASEKNGRCHYVSNEITLEIKCSVSLIVVGDFGEIERIPEHNAILRSLESRFRIINCI